MKRWFAWLLAAVLALSVPAIAAEDYAASTAVITIDGVRTTFFDDAGGYLSPVEKDGALYVPVLSLAESLGLDATADPDTLAVTIKGVRAAFFDESGAFLSPLNVDGVVYVPLKAFAETAGVELSVEGDAYRIVRFGDAAEEAPAESPAEADAEAADEAAVSEEPEDPYGYVPLGMDNYQEYYSLTERWYTSRSQTSYTLEISARTSYEAVDVAFDLKGYGHLEMSDKRYITAHYIASSGNSIGDRMVADTRVILGVGDGKHAATPSRVRGMLRMDRATADEINEGDYQSALTKAEEAKSVKMLDFVIGVFDRLASVGYKDSAEQAQAAREKRDEKQNAEYYAAAQAAIEAGDLDAAIEALQAIDGEYEDSAALLKDALAQRDERERAAEQQALEARYRQAEAVLAEGKYDEAIEIFKELSRKLYGDSAERIQEAYCAWAGALEAEGDIFGAITKYRCAGDYPDAVNAIKAIYYTRHKTLSTGFWDTIAIQADGSVVSTGYNDPGSYDVGEWHDIVQVSASGSSEENEITRAGLRSDGTVVVIGDNTYGQCDVADWHDIVWVVTTGCDTVGLKADGTVVFRGWDGVLPDFVTDPYDFSGWRDIVQISGDKLCIVGLKSDGTIIGEGVGYILRPEVYGNQIESWSDIVAVETSSRITVCLKVDGTVVFTVAAIENSLHVSDWKDIVAVSCSNGHIVGLKSDGTVVATGSNDHGQCDVADWRDIIAIAAHGFHTIGLKADGTVVATGDNDYGQCDVSGWSYIMARPAPGMDAALVEAAAQAQIEAPSRAAQARAEAEAQAAAEAAYEPLAKGSKGEAVKALQEKLIEQGYLTGKADGDYGNKTVKAVAAFQREAGLPETGEADPKTQAALFGK